MTEILESDIENEFQLSFRATINSGTQNYVFTRYIDIPFDVDAIICSQFSGTSSSLQLVYSMACDLPIMNNDFGHLYMVSNSAGGFARFNPYNMNFFLTHTKKIKGNYTFRTLDINNNGMVFYGTYQFLLRFIKFKQ